MSSTKTSSVSRRLDRVKENLYQQGDVLDVIGRGAGNPWESCTVDCPCTMEHGMVHILLYSA